MQLTNVRRRLVAGVAAALILAAALGGPTAPRQSAAAGEAPETLAAVAADRAGSEAERTAVTIIDGGRVRSVETAAKTVAELLQEQFITLGELDSLSVPADTPVTAGLEVRITRRAERIETAAEEVPYGTLERADGSLALGATELVQAGAPGRKLVERMVLYEDGQAVASHVVAETVIEDPTPEIVAYGTAGVVSRGGQQIRYTQELELVATGYTAGPESNPGSSGLTYTGIPAARGIAAVDPNVIPLYTRLYVEGYGFALAADIGGAIKGNRIDLCFDTVDEALAWGVRPVKVYVLQD